MKKEPLSFFCHKETGLKRQKKKFSLERKNVPYLKMEGDLIILNKKWLAGVLSTSFVASMLAFPGLTQAQTGLADQVEASKRLKTIQKIEQFLDQNKPASSAQTAKSTSATSATSVAVTEATYQNSVSLYEPPQLPSEGERKRHLADRG